ncbi:hypothetical protein [Enhydrobacter aerosaccus]|uniref:hypothetical protein n=1 Tax=Enhydrobacter aerosaccus TaxID=225324 RepID=UPI000A2EFC99|nr:hypothetical protein [Enhydrobacter aerosaccus]
MPDPSSLDPDPWRIGFTAYGWAINVAGSVTARGQTVDVNASFIDLLQKSDSLIGWMSYFEADKGRVGFYGDLVWTRLGFARSMAAYRNPLPGLQISVTANAALVTDMVIAEMGGLYEVERWPGSDGSFTAVDALLGFRYWNSSTYASVDALGTASYAPLGIEASRQFGISLSNTMQWVDPLVGLRLRHRFTPHQEILVRGDIGGFGLGSQLTWQALGVYSYEWQIDRTVLAAVIGYRAIGVNYGAGSGFDASGMNLVLHGPVIGIGLRF